MATTTRDAGQRSAAAAVKAERALDKVAAMQEYEAEGNALRAKTERLRALRLASEAGARQATAAEQPATKGAPGTTMQGPVRKPIARRVSKRA
jgi:hypothetical protein